jgi:hypothetical protein
MKPPERAQALDYVFGNRSAIKAVATFGGEGASP